VYKWLHRRQTANKYLVQDDRHYYVTYEAHFTLLNGPLRFIKRPWGEAATGAPRVLTQS